MNLSETLILDSSKTCEASAAKSFVASRHQLELDGIRGIAASMVIFYHGSYVFSHNIMDSIYARLMAFCHSGVDLFFVMSGYLITSILYRDIEIGNPVRYFYFRRALRILPLLFLLVLTLGLGPVFFRQWPVPPIPTGELIASILFFSNIKMASYGYYFLNFLGCTWSVSLEEQFYLVWPSIVRRLTKERLLKFCGLVILFSLLIRLVLTMNAVSPVFINVMFFTRLDTLAFGAALFLLNSQLQTNKNSNLYSFIIFTLGLSLIFIIEFCERATYPFLGNSVGLSLMGLTFSALLFLALNLPEKSLIRKLFRNPVLTIPGKFCYGVYLLHGPVIYWFRHFLYPKFPWLQFTHFSSSLLSDSLRLSTFWVATLVVSFVSYYGFEKMFLSLQNRFR